MNSTKKTVSQNDDSNKEIQALLGKNYRVCLKWKEYLERTLTEEYSEDIVALYQNETTFTETYPKEAAQFNTLRRGVIMPEDDKIFKGITTLKNLITRLGTLFTLSSAHQTPLSTTQFGTLVNELLEDKNKRFLDSTHEEKEIYKTIQACQALYYQHHAAIQRMVRSLSIKGGMVYAFQDIFNHKNTTRSNIAAFFAKPSPHNALNYMELILWPLNIMKNILKFGIEFIPAMFEVLSLRSMQLCQNALLKPHNNFSKFGLYCGIFLSGLCYLIFALLRQVTMRLTSPIRAMKEAYSFGKHYHPILGGFLAACSIALSAALIGTLIFFGGPFIAAKCGLTLIASALNAGTNWIAAQMGLNSLLATLSPIGIVTASVFTLPFLFLKGLFKWAFEISKKDSTPQKNFLELDQLQTPVHRSRCTASIEDTPKKQPVSFDRLGTTLPLLNEFAKDTNPSSSGLFR